MTEVPVVAPSPPTPLQVLTRNKDNIAVPQDVAKTLLAAGFERKTDLRDQFIAKAESRDLSHNGAYVVQDVWQKGLVTLLFEQNTATQTINGLTAAISHPAVCILSSPEGRVAVNANDADLILSVASDLG